MKRCGNCGRLEECDKFNLWKKLHQEHGNYLCWCPDGCLLIETEVEI